MMSATPVLPMIAVLDTNVVIAGLLWHGPPRSLLVRATECDDFIVATSPVLIEELFGTLSLPRFQKRIAEAGKSTEALVAAYRALSDASLSSRSSREISHADLVARWALNRRHE